MAVRPWRNSCSTDNIINPETGEQRTTKEWEDYVAGVSPGTEKDEAGNYRDERTGRIAGAREMKQAAIEAGTARIQLNNYNEMKQADGQYRDLMRNAYVNGKLVHNEAYQEAQRIYAEWVTGGKKADALKKENREYAEGDKDSIALFFPEYDYAAGGAGGGTAGPWNDRSWWVQQGANGAMTAPEALAGYRRSVENAAANAGMSPEEFERYHQGEIRFEDFYGDMVKLFLKQNPHISADVFDRLTRFIDDWVENAPGNEKELRRRQGRKVFDFFADFYLDRTSAEQLSHDDMIAKVGELTTELTEQKVAFMRETAGGESTYLGRAGQSKDETFAAATLERQEHPEGVAEFADGRIEERGNPASIREYKEAARDNLRTILHAPNAYIDIGYDREITSYDPTTGEGLSYDLASTLVLNVTGAGEKNGTYRFVADSERQYHLEKKDASGRWAPGPRGMAGEVQARGDAALDSALGAAVQERERRAMGTLVSNTIELIRTEEDPLKRQQLAGELLSVPGAAEQLRAAGIDPFTGKDLK